MDEYNERYGNVYKEKAKQERSRNIGTPTTFYNEPKKRVKIASPIEDINEVSPLELSAHFLIFLLF